jgi:hypothetical protein
MILTSYFYVGVHYKKNNGVSNNIDSVRIVTLWKWVVMALTAAGSSGLLWNTAQGVQFLLTHPCSIIING